MVAITPMDEKRLEGRAACLASWQRFVDQVSITQWETTEEQVQIYGNTAVVTYYYHLVGELNQKRLDLHGRNRVTFLDRHWLAPFLWIVQRVEGERMVAPRCGPAKREREWPARIALRTGPEDA